MAADPRRPCQLLPKAGPVKAVPLSRPVPKDALAVTALRHGRYIVVPLGRRLLVPRLASPVRVAARGPVVAPVVEVLRDARPFAAPQSAPLPPHIAADVLAAVLALAGLPLPATHRLAAHVRQLLAAPRLAARRLAAHIARPTRLQVVSHAAVAAKGLARVARPSTRLRDTPVRLAASLPLLVRHLARPLVAPAANIAVPYVFPLFAFRLRPVLAAPATAATGRRLRPPLLTTCSVSDRDDGPPQPTYSTTPTNRNFAFCAASTGVSR